MTTLTHCICTLTVAWRTCIELARTAHLPQFVMIHAHLMAQVLSTFIVIHCHNHGRIFLTRLLPFLLPLPPVCHRLPLALSLHLDLRSLLFFLPSLFLHLFLFLTNKKFMENLYNSAKEGVDTTDD